MRPTWAFATLLSLALSGCVGSADDDAPAGQIDGAVVDGLLRPHGNATVRLLELDRTTRTNDLGGFTFFDVPPGRHTVQAEFAGLAARTTVPVRDADVAQTILQILLPAPPLPHVAALRHQGHADLGVPGTPCEPCSWTTPLHDRPDHLRLTASWTDTGMEGSPTRLIVEVRDDVGRLLAVTQGHSPLTARLDGATVPARAEHLEIRVYFHPDNEVPHPAFTMESSLCLFYDVSPDDGYGCMQTARA